VVVVGDDQPRGEVAAGDVDAEAAVVVERLDGDAVEVGHPVGELLAEPAVVAADHADAGVEAAPERRPEQQDEEEREDEDEEEVGAVAEEPPHRGAGDGQRRPHAVTSAATAVRSRDRARCVAATIPAIANAVAAKPRNAPTAGSTSAGPPSWRAPTPRRNHWWGVRALRVSSTPPIWETGKNTPPSAPRPTEMIVCHTSACSVVRASSTTIVTMPTAARTPATISSAMPTGS